MIKETFILGEENGKKQQIARINDQAIIPMMKICPVTIVDIIFYDFINVDWFGF